MKITVNGLIEALVTANTPDANIILLNPLTLESGRATDVYLATLVPTGKERVKITAIHRFNKEQPQLKAGELLNKLCEYVKVRPAI